ncbi:MAG: winged helix-turn-helix domain-containing protein [bacterium]|nr:winged helix-turn-helix domain-containing protein [bacterium]
MPDANNRSINNYRRLERLVKGFANHRRLEILNLLHKEPELSVEDISERLHIGYENASDHLRKMAIAGLILKRNDARSVRHKLTLRAEHVLTFCKMLE